MDGIIVFLRSFDEYQPEVGQALCGVLLLIALVIGRIFKTLLKAFCGTEEDSSVQ